LSEEELILEAVAKIINASRIFLRDCKYAVFAQNPKTNIRIFLKGEPYKNTAIFSSIIGS